MRGEGTRQRHGGQRLHRAWGTCVHACVQTCACVCIVKRDAACASGQQRMQCSRMLVCSTNCSRGGVHVCVLAAMRVLLQKHVCVQLRARVHASVCACTAECGCAAVCVHAAVCASMQLCVHAAVCMQQCTHTHL